MSESNKYAVRKLFLTILFFFVAFSGSTQIAINSPYSRYGLGDISARRNAYQYSMGGISMAIASNRYINPYNPAANFAFDSLSFIFSGGIIGSTGSLKTDDLDATTNFASLGYLLFGFPVTKWLKTTVGLTPYSNVGYNIASATVIEGVGSTEYRFEGSGGLNEFYGNVSIEPFEGFSVGAKMSYMFGKSDIARTIFFPDSIGYLNTRVDNYIEVGDLYFEYGMQYHHKLGKNLTLGIGGIFAPKQSVKAVENYLARSFFATSLNTESFRDTIASRIEDKGVLEIPDKYGFGFTLRNQDKWLFGADYSWQNWSEFTAFGRSDSLKNTMQINIGGEFTPGTSITASYWKRIKYRLGFRYNQTYLEIRNNRINEFGITFGMGLPIPRSFSTINVAVELGRKGTLANGLIQSNYLRLTLGISVWERWFVKPKYN